MKTICRVPRNYLNVETYFALSIFPIYYKYNKVKPGVGTVLFIV